MLNIFSSGDKTKWDTSPADYDRERCISKSEYTLPQFVERYGSFTDDNIRELKEFPCIFAYEKYCRDKDAYIGKIIDLVVTDRIIIIYYKLLSRISNNDFRTKIIPLLEGDGIGWSWTRTCWALKDLDIHNIFPEVKPTVFISYCWTQADKVHILADKLINDGIKVIIDRDHLHPGQDISFFMEQNINNPETDAVLVFCSQGYEEKGNRRQAGVGYEMTQIVKLIKGKPEQEKVIPIVMERNEDGTPYIPSSLSERVYIDLSTDDSVEYDKNYKKLVEAIKRQTQEWGF